MAVITLDFHSKALKMSTLVTLIVPDSVRIGEAPLSERRTVYLLHGLSEDATAFLRLSNAERYARAHDLVLVMPTGGRSMYCDGINGQNWFSYIAEELPEYLHLLMGLSRRREQNFIAGYSMGGMGAARIALAHPDHYAAWGSLSGVLDLRPMLLMLNDELRTDFPFLAGKADEIDTTPLNPINLLDAEKHAGFRAYLACGEQDPMIFGNRSFAERAHQVGLHAAVTFEDSAHDWDFWDRHLKKFFEFIEG